MTNYLKILDLRSSSSRMKNNLCTLPLHKKYRGHFEIIGLLLEAVEDNGATRFSIMRHTRTNYKQLEKYLDSLTKIGFIEMAIREDQCLYRATEKGLSFLKQYHILLGMLLSAFTRSNPVSVDYETKCDASTTQQRPAAPLVTGARHNL